MEQADNILMAYLRVTQHMSQMMRGYFGQMNLTFPQALVLTVLGEEGPVPISVLAERTGSANSTISGIVDRLERLELAVRRRSQVDRRVIYVEATEKYHSLHDRARTDVISYFNSLMSGVSEADQELVASALTRLDEILTQKVEAGGGSLAVNSGSQTKKTGPAGA